MNDRQKIFLISGYMIIFLIFFYTFLRFITNINFFILSIILLGSLFFTMFFDSIVMYPIIESIGYMKGESVGYRKGKSYDLNRMIKKLK